MDTPRDCGVTEIDETLRLIRVGQERAWLAANAVMIETYAAVGAMLSRKVREDGWGSDEIEALSDRLVRSKAGSIGFTMQNLERMKTFHDTWMDKGAIPAGLFSLSWSCHLILLERCTIARERMFYLEACLAENWTPKELASKIQEGSSGRRRQKLG